MKKILFAAAIMMALGLQSAKAQDSNPNWTRNDISIGYSYESVPQLGLGTKDALSNFLSMTPLGKNFDVNSVSFKTTGSFSLEYNHRFTKVFSLGFVGAFEKFEEQVTGTANYDSRVANAALSMNVTSLRAMLNFRFFWFNYSHVSMYSKIAGGVAFFADFNAKASVKELQDKIDSLKLSVLPSFQVSPVCVDFGGSTVRGFVELGFGFQGLATGGVRFRF